MKDVKLILLDLDGTLLDGESKVAQGFFELVHDLRQIGVQIGIASGRNRSSLENLFKETFNQMACVTTNGAANYIDGKLISADYLHEDICKELIQEAQGLGNKNVVVLTPDYVYIQSEDNTSIEKLNAAGFSAKGCKSLLDHLDEVTLLNISDPQRISFMDHFDQLQGNYSYASPSTGSIDFMNKVCTKAYGASKLAENLGITMEQIMAIGDAGNDLPLLKAVGYPVAMLNGSDECKAACKYITDYTNKEYGTVKFIRRFFGIE